MEMTSDSDQDEPDEDGDDGDDGVDDDSPLLLALLDLVGTGSS